jgi:hypothetical protein
LSDYRKICRRTDINQASSRHTGEVGEELGDRKRSDKRLNNSFGFLDNIL